MMENLAPILPLVGALIGLAIAVIARAIREMADRTK